MQTAPCEGLALVAAGWTSWASFSLQQPLRGCSERSRSESHREKSYSQVLPPPAITEHRKGQCFLTSWQFHLLELTPDGNASELGRSTRSTLTVFCSSGNFTDGNIMEKQERTSTKGPSGFGGKTDHTLLFKANKQQTGTKKQVSSS